MAANRNRQGRNTDPLVVDPVAVAAIEAKNALLQFDEVRRLVALRLSNLNLTPADVCELQRIAVQGICPSAGKLREGPIIIGNTKHRPPAWQDVPKHMADMCDYANSVADQSIHVSAYLMWRLNWIHPFVDGNGRTSRAISYLALCCGFGMELPGTVTVPDLIVKNRSPYYHALDAADAAWKDGNLDVSQMEELMETLLIQQLDTAV